MNASARSASPLEGLSSGRRRAHSQSCVRLSSGGASRSRAELLLVDFRGSVETSRAEKGTGGVRRRLPDRCREAAQPLRQQQLLAEEAVAVDQAPDQPTTGFGKSAVESAYSLVARRRRRVEYGWPQLARR